MKVTFDIPELQKTRVTVDGGWGNEGETVIAIPEAKITLRLPEVDTAKAVSDAIDAVLTNPEKTGLGIEAGDGFVFISRLGTGDAPKFFDLGDPSLAPPVPVPANMTPTDAMIRVLEMVRAKGWEMPYRSALNIAHTQKTGRVEADVAHFHWWDGHEMNTNHNASFDVGDGGVTAWKQTRDDRVRRKWPETTAASIDAALTFLLGGGK